jgi:uncharacterized protein (TIGR02270 family)
MRTSGSKPIISGIVRQHIEEAAALRVSRTQLVREANGGPEALTELDERLQAHLDALAVAGDAAWPLCQKALEEVSSGTVFVSAVHAIEAKRLDRLEQLIALAQAVPEAMAGLSSAFGWVEPPQLRNIVANLLRSTDVATRIVGIAACALHRVDPGLRGLLDDSNATVRARALRTAGELGKREWLPACIGALDDEDSACKLWGARSAVLLGDRQRALDWLVTLVSTTPHSPLFDVVLTALPLQAGHEVLRTLAGNPAHAGRQLRGAGLVGDAGYVSWLVRRMQDPLAARRAAEAFALITGADLVRLNMEGEPPADFASGPSDDPSLADVAMDADDHLPWPDAERVERWWAQNSSRFTPKQRYFVGAPLTREQCIEVLQSGCQPQRSLAAYHLCHLEPGSVLFEWRAPAWRQAQELAALG